MVFVVGSAPTLTQLAALFAVRLFTWGLKGENNKDQFIKKTSL